MTTTNEIIIEIKKYFKANMMPVSYDLFIEPLECIHVDNTEVILKTSSEWTKSVIDKRFIEDIQLVTKNLLNKQITIITTTN